MLFAVFTRTIGEKRIINLSHLCNGSNCTLKNIDVNLTPWVVNPQYDGVNIIHQQNCIDTA